MSNAVIINLLDSVFGDFRNKTRGNPSNSLISLSK